MTTPEELYSTEVDRRRLLAVAGYAGAVLGAAPAAAAAPRTEDARRTERLSAPAVCGLHLQFGADASSQMTASWQTLEPVERPRVLVGTTEGGLRRTVPARTVSYRDAKSGKTVFAHHALMDGLSAATTYLYGAVHEGAQPRFATFQTAPRGRASFTFTSFGDQGTPTLGRRQGALAASQGVQVAPQDQTGPFVNDNLGSPAAADTTLGVERAAPLFHLFNGDLCYANLAHDRVRAWWDFFENNSRSAMNRPWMPSPGNHENELGNGPIGYLAYQTLFSVPGADEQTEETRGLWYAFTAGAVRVVSLANDDITYQDAGDSYVRGYSKGRQRAWLEAELSRTRADPQIDWIVVCMHQTAISTADHFNGADLGIREEWSPLFDRYGVDLVVCGHEHHYERSHPVRGHEANPTLTPRPADTRLDRVDTDKGTVHMVLGGGGTSIPSNRLLFDPPQCRVITAVGPPDARTGRRPPVYVHEAAPWCAVRNAGHAYGFAAFSVEAGMGRGTETRMNVTYYDVMGPDGSLRPFESFTLRRTSRA